jgi:hypothetical protein
MIADVKCEEADMGLFSVKLPVIAILHGDLFVGNAVAYLSRKGTIDLRSVLDANGKCFGSFRFTDAKTGVADMQCNDGSAARLSFSALGAFSEFYFWASTGSCSVAFDIAPRQETRGRERGPQTGVGEIVITRHTCAILEGKRS